MSERYLRVGILHLDVVARRLDLNLANFLALAEEAADKGAQLVVGTEMSLSGYCFEDRDSLLPYAQSEDGEALGQISKWAAKRGVYVAIGLAELAKPEGIIYNSAFFIDDKGKILGRARKINAESRWACPGPPVQDNIWPTPWGQVGMRICSDSWHSLIIRISALKGADLLLLPANCPPMGLDPCDLWRFRAKENGLWFIACNRTGQEKDLDCLEATSCAFDPYGQELFRGQSPQSAAFMVDLPLNEKGQLDNQRKKEILAQRTPQNHYRLCGNFNYIKDLTRYLKLPEPGELELTAFIPRAQENPADFLENTPQPWPNGLIFLPNWPYSPNDLERLNNLAGD
ncbi:MAG: carbon-nitrogen hydrolase family protein, partial [Deltaproteobacteria bacterium]|nr:carbon-nitrogen hydrolase family protein [Deltaproteobacteria bacterium]